MKNSRGQGRKPKPTAQKVRNGSAKNDPGRINRSEPAALLDEPICPNHLSGVAREAWLRIADTMREMGYLSKTYQDALEIYAETYASYRRTLEKVSQHGVALVSQHPETGEVIIRRNPFSTELNKQKKLLLQILSEFGMTPSSKTRVSGDGPKEFDPIAEILNRRSSLN